MKEGKAAVLVVEDQMVNRQVLAKMLFQEYDVLQAENGKAAQKILKKKGKNITAILLDLVMPIMNGYEFLKWLKDTEYSCLPVIVLTGEHDTECEQKALDCGAWDFVSKPYRPSVLLSRLRNAIARSQMYLLDKLKYMTEYDTLTGLYNRSWFFEETRRMLDKHSDEKFVFVRFDINHFRLLRSFGGETESNQMLQYLAGVLREVLDHKRHCTYGRVEADIFCFCEPYDEAGLQEQIGAFHQKLQQYDANLFLEPSFGFFVVDDPKLPVEAMLGRATMAAGECKRRYLDCVARYDRNMDERMCWEQFILEEMQPALDAGQFVVYFQPKFDLKSNLPCGAEALVRWEHPQRGLITPGRFIPIFERNGLIGKLDYYMWDTVCRLLRKWLDEGCAPAPVSVNISRADMYNPKLAEQLNDLVKKYDVPPALLNLELTESAYMDDPDMMEKTVQNLQKSGFLVMMDDFGSGYSSLNMLKDIAVDMLKVDMKFLSGNKSQNDRSERILASVIHMAGWLNLPVIMEGVETRQQAEFLRNVGCEYAQGYYFAQAMPTADYEELIHKKTCRPIPRPAPSDSVCLVADMIWAENPQVELLLRSIRHPVVVYEFQNDIINPLYFNETYTRWFNRRGRGNRPLFSQLDAKDQKKLLTAFRRAAGQTGAAECNCLWRDDNGDQRWLWLELNYIGDNSGSAILVGIYTDFTRMRTEKTGDS
ncbi:MAG: EAL domain-containing protein [Intestinimonas sp.]|jgi:EAL domain-containing protein (putative c-di-GMP-specific phosphodiesterase class I)/DNA-binding response OmpR family regulator|nr:EAL domain-containing protein [Intestinimonas sp.]